MEGGSFLRKTYSGKHSKVVSGYKMSLIFILLYVGLSFVYVCVSVGCDLITFLSLGNILKG